MLKARVRPAIPIGTAIRTRGVQVRPPPRPSQSRPCSRGEESENLVGRSKHVPNIRGFARCVPRLPVRNYSCSHLI
jgi:hypothetical protein